MLVLRDVMFGGRDVFHEVQLAGCEEGIATNFLASRLNRLLPAAHPRQRTSWATSLGAQRGCDAEHNGRGCARGARRSDWRGPAMAALRRAA